jgi:hypothetical protein
MTFQTAAERLENIRKILADEYGVSRIGIFGSVARNEQKESSDIDILVRLDHSVGLLEFAGLWEYLKDTLGQEVDVADIDDLRPDMAEHIKSEVRYV